MSEEEILSSEVLKDEQRLAHDGYIGAISEEDGTISIDVMLKRGQHRGPRWPLVTMPNNAAAQVRLQQLLMVVDAMLAFMNTGGAPEDLADLGNHFGLLPGITHHGYELLGIVEDANRQYYYGEAGVGVYRVYPGLLTEEVSEAEVKRMIEEEDGEIAFPQTFAQDLAGENSLGWPGDDEA